MQLINAINISYASSHFSESSRLAIIGLYISCALQLNARYSMDLHLIARHSEIKFVVNTGGLYVYF